jgi:hypothetical protein
MSADAMSQPQADREVDEALRVYEMGPSEREQWLRTSWDRLQSQADALYAVITFKREPGRQFRTIEERNRSDESLEISIEDPPSLEGTGVATRCTANAQSGQVTCHPLAWRTCGGGALYERTQSLKTA